MRILCLLLIAVSLVCPALTKAQDSDEFPATPFHMSSFNSAFGMQAEFDGEYRIYPDTIEIDVTKAHIRVSTHCPYKGRREFSALKFELGVAIDERRWDIAAASQKFVVGRVMSPGDEYEFGPIHFTIPIENGADLSKNWLVAQLDEIALDHPSGKPSRGFSVVQSCRDIFARQEIASARADHDPSQSYRCGRRRA